MQQVNEKYVAIIDDSAFYNAKLWDRFTERSNIHGIYLKGPVACIYNITKVNDSKITVANFLNTKIVEIGVFRQGLPQCR
jgi:hypothetical protein